MKDLQIKSNLFHECKDKEEMDIWSAELQKEKALLFAQIENIYRDFDAKIDDLCEQSIEISLKIQFMELYYFVLYQQILVLNKFEEPHKSLLQSIDTTNDKLKRNDEEMRIAKAKFKEQLNDDALIDPSGKIIEMELLFKVNGKLTY